MHQCLQKSGHLFAAGDHAVADCKFVSIQGNHISQLDGVTQLPSLTLLDLSCNRVTRLPALSTLTRLQHLNMYSNQITSLAGGLLKHPKYHMLAV